MPRLRWVRQAPAKRALRRLPSTSGVAVLREARPSKPSRLRKRSSAFSARGAARPSIQQILFSSVVELRGLFLGLGPDGTRVLSGLQLADCVSIPDEEAASFEIDLARIQLLQGCRELNS